MTSPIVEISQGKLRGKLSNANNGFKYFTFKGIPYAKPPVGDLRFKDAVPPEPWEDVFDATKECNKCPQFDKESLSVAGDEDCLVLNVYAPVFVPNETNKLLPVMFFLHGGGFAYGTGTDDNGQHSPEYLIQKEIVVVSINYRVGILGFLNLDLVEAPGNMGLKDQVLALKWVQKNISKFCGDPNNVTIFGISAGGASVEYLMVSQMARGLFHKAIAQSGSTLNHWTINKKPKEIAFRVAELKGKNITKDDELCEYLKNLPIQDLITSANLALIKADYRGGIYFGFVPTIEKSGKWDTFLTKPTYELLKNGDFAKVPFISGFCSNEGLLMLGFDRKKLDEVVAFKKLAQHFPFEIDDNDRGELENKLKAAYLDHSPNNYSIDFFTDLDFLGGIYVATKLISKKSSPVFFYEFAYDGSFNYLKKKFNLKVPGTCHGDDGGYLVKSNILKESDASKTDLLVRERMVGMWTNFAKYGNPTPKCDEVINTIWEPIKENEFNYMVIDKDLTIKQEVLPHRMKIYEDMYEKYWFRN